MNQSKLKWISQAVNKLSITNDAISQLSHQILNESITEWVDKSNIQLVNQYTEQ